MDTSKSFDAYEVIGIITPGTLVALLLLSEAPLFHRLLLGQSLTIGDLGLFLLLALVFGQLIQAFGNLIEWMVWLRFGLPTNFVRVRGQRLITPTQRMALEAKIAAMEGEKIDLSATNRTQWRAMTARAYARVHAAGRSVHVDIYNRTYGLCRGLVAATGLAFFWCIYAHRDQPALLVVLALMTTAAVFRMRRAGIHYARTLFLEFIDLDRV
ncbi:MAG: hypothetical protein P4L57_06455 [Rhizomicrobium sp.]|nr:hypothetical protein [Rhizomicrobium sp.]